MKKTRRIINVFIFIMFGFLFSNFIVYAIDNIPTEITIRTNNIRLGEVYYEGYTLSAYKVESKEGLGYCLEINKEYPSGENFKLKGNCSEEIKNVLISGYPNKSAKELNLDSDDDAYFSTQMVIWSVIEGYDVNKFTGSNPKVISAIKNIYENSKIAAPSEMIYEGKEYYFEQSIQDVVMLFKTEYGQGKPIPPVVELPQTGDESYFNLLAVIGVACIILGFSLRLNNPKA